MPHVASTLTADNKYVEYVEGGADMQIPAREVLIKGGIGIPDRNLVTPTGAILTEVTDEEAKILANNAVFKMHERNGYVQILGKKADGDKIASGMVTRDGSAPLTPSHFSEKNDDPATLSVNSGNKAA